MPVGDTHDDAAHPERWRRRYEALTSRRQSPSQVTIALGSITLWLLQGKIDFGIIDLEPCKICSIASTRPKEANAPSSAWMREAFKRAEPLLSTLYIDLSLDFAVDLFS
jgi:hypothetical protein